MLTTTALLLNLSVFFSICLLFLMADHLLFCFAGALSGRWDYAAGSELNFAPTSSQQHRSQAELSRRQFGWYLSQQRRIRLCWPTLAQSARHCVQQVRLSKRIKLFCCLFFPYDGDVVVHCVGMDCVTNLSPLQMFHPLNFCLSSPFCVRFVSFLLPLRFSHCVSSLFFYYCLCRAALQFLLF